MWILSIDGIEVSLVLLPWSCELWQSTGGRGSCPGWEHLQSRLYDLASGKPAFANWGRGRSRSALGEGGHSPSEWGSTCWCEVAVKMLPISGPSQTRARRPCCVRTPAATCTSSALVMWHLARVHLFSPLPGVCWKHRARQVASGSV